MLLPGIQGFAHAVSTFSLCGFQRFVNKTMKIDSIKNILLAIVLLLMQVLVLNHVHLFDYATPLLYVMPALLFRRNYPRWAILIWCFLLGLGVDVFANTPGVAAASMTLVGLAQPILLSMLLTRESEADLQPSIRSLGFTRFLYFTFILVFLYCVVFFTIETFNFFQWLQWLLCIAGSTVLTVVLILAIENLRER